MTKGLQPARTGEPRRVLIVDDDPALRDLLQRFCRRLGYEPIVADSCRDGEEQLSKSRVDLMILDMQLQDGLGLDFCERMLPLHPAVPVIFMTGDGALESAVAAMRLGAKDFLLKPFGFEPFARSLKATLEVPPRQEPAPAVKLVIGDSVAMQDVWNQIAVFTGTDITVLLLGESGTGKEMFARAIHAQSKRSQGPFIELDCASLPGTLIEAELFGHEKGAFTDAHESRPGKFEMANGGTLFLDELGNLALETQSKLLRVVQERSFRRIGGQNLITVDIRIIAATNLNLEEAVRRGAFRSDLFFRLSEMPLRLPPLRERRGDVEKLSNYFLRKYGERYNKQIDGITLAALAALEEHPWPGNVRELENIIRAAVLRSDRQVDTKDFSMWSFQTPKAAVAPPNVRSTPGPVQPDSTATEFVADNDYVHIKIPWPGDDSGLDLKHFLQNAKLDLERHIFRTLQSRRMNKAQMARFLHLDYKFFLEKLRASDVDLGGAPPGEP